MKPSTKDRLIPAALIALALVPSLAGGARLLQLASGADITPENARFFNSPLPVLLHIPAAIIYSLLGAFQFAPGFRQRHLRWHRVSGLLLVPGALVVALTGLWMAHFYPWPAGDGAIVYAERLVVGVVMLGFTGMGIDAIRRRSFREHGEWMARAYAIALGAGTQVFTHLPWFLLVDTAPGERARGVLMGAAWAINAVVAEWIIRRARARQTVTRATTFRTAGATSATVGNATGHVVRQLRSQAVGNAALQP
jgi:Predicted membrane protein (DUF2306)/PepSY-associated TM region